MGDPTRLLGWQPRPAAWMVRISGRDAGRDWRLSSDTSIGRDPRHNDIVLDDPTVSLQHAKIRLEGRQYTVYDLGSLNGTRVNGVKTQKTILYDGDILQFGDVTCVFKRA